MAIKKLMLSSIMGILAVLVLAFPASAGREWSATDPIVALNGTEVQVWVAIPVEYTNLVNGPIQVVVRTPSTVERSVVFTDAGPNGYGEAVHFLNSSGVVNELGAFRTDIAVAIPLDFGRAWRETGSLRIPMMVTIIFNGQEKVIEGWSSGILTSIQVQGAQ